VSGFGRCGHRVLDEVTPEMVGLISYDGTRRRVKGLRREGSRLMPGSASK
jgi:hypothetical protein